MNKLFIIFGLAALFVPVLATAQDTGPTSSIYCPNLTQSLSMGSRDSQTNPRGQVTELQRFLSDYYDLNPDDYVTGYFGRLTRDNVRKFQCARMSICSGDELSTGWGFVGRMTRAAITQSCGTTTVVPPISCPIYSPPQCTGGTLVSQGVDANGCQRPLRCDTHTIITPLPPASCTFNGKIIAHGQSVTAYQAASVPAWTNCTAEVRSCSNGTLSGSYQYATCTPQGVTSASCTFNGQTVAHGQSVTAYEASWVGPGKQCISQTRTCQNGALSGSYAFHSCYTQTVNCPLLSPPQCTGGTLVSNGTDANGCSLGYRCEMPGNTSPTITITAPQAGSANPLNTPMHFSWQSTNAPLGSKVAIYVRQVPQAYDASVVAYNKEPNDSATWTPTQSLHKNYNQVFASLQLNNATLAETSVPISIIDANTTGAPSITVTAPLAGASYTQGTPIVFSWTSQNAPGNARVTITIYNHSTGASVAGFVGLPLTGGHTYLPVLVPGTYRARLGLVSSTGVVLDVKENIFTVTGSTGAAITVTAPASGASVSKSNPFTVSWTSHNAPSGAKVIISVIENPQIHSTYNSGVLDASGSHSVQLPSYFDLGAGRIIVSLRRSATDPTQIAQTSIPINIVAGGTGGTLSIGDRVKANYANGIMVMSTPSNTSGQNLGTQPNGSLGSVVGGPGSGNGYTWWNVNWDTGPDGWSVQEYLQKVTQSTGTGLGSCMYKGQSYAEGSTAEILHPSTNNVMATYLCETGTWIYPATTVTDPNNISKIREYANVCTYISSNSVAPSRADLNCLPVPSNFFQTSYVLLAGFPRHGTAPFTFTLRSSAGFLNGACAAFTINWGDGTSTSHPQASCVWPNGGAIKTNSHTYSNPGTYTISFVDPLNNHTHSATIRVNGTTASTQNSFDSTQDQSQLASALSALQSALLAIQKLLGQ